jgi:membrane associated rhomboid family serine protease
MFRREAGVYSSQRVTWVVCGVSLVVSSLAAVLQRQGVHMFDAWVFNIDVLWKGEFWRVLTYPFIHSSPSGLFWDVLFFYLLGRSLESSWGSKDFFWFLFWSAVGAAFLSLPLAWCVNVVLPVQSLGYAEGLSCVINAMLIAIVLSNPNTTLMFGFVLPVSGKSLIGLLLLVEVVSSLYAGVTSLAMTLGGMAMGWILTKGAWRWSFLTRFVRAQKRRPNKRGLYVVYPPRNDKTLH